nr:AAA family ATPase [Bacillota bacterium]
MVETETIYGYLERITYYNEENHFMVARVQEKGKRGLTTIVGNLAGLCPGVLLKLEGKWGHHKQFGEQFQVERFDIVVPATVKGIEKYLGSGLIRGIGPVMARRIVKVFGLDTLDIIEHHPEQLARVEGIGEKRIEMIKEAWEEQKGVREIMIFLQDCGVSAAYAARIYKQYGRESVQVVRTNPYRLASEVRGIGFITADRIAREMGIDPNSVTRAEEGALYILNQCTGEGHVYYPYKQLVEKTTELLQVEQEVVVRGLERLLESRRVVMEDLSRYGEAVDGEEKAVYLAPFHHCEVNLARRLLQLREQQGVLPVEDWQPVLDRVERQLGVKLAPRQREAVEQSLFNKVLVITGGPGTGKTTIIKAILELFRSRNMRVLLAAPTGRAAKRMQEATGYEARTLHRLLEYSPRQGGFSRNEDNPLEAEVLIVDEASMIDLLLMYHLVKAIPPQASLILVGDTNQLPSVGPGHVLKSIIDSGKFKVITLVDIFRQSRWSRIVVNAHRINQGEFPEIKNP